jgi:hypothetical protein
MKKKRYGICFLAAAALIAVFIRSRLSSLDFR